MKSNQKFSVEKTTETIKIYCYKYLWRTNEDKICVKFLTETQEGHALFQSRLKEDPNIISAMREYCHEINFAYINFTEPVKEEKKEGDRNEKI